MKPVVLAAMLVYAPLLPAATSSDVIPYSSLELGEAGPVTVRLEYRAVASVADFDWMKLVFENHGATAVRFTDGYFGTDRTTFVRGTDRRVSSGGLASGNSYDLFGSLPDRGVLEPGTHEIVELTSYYSSALLRIPPEQGRDIRASITLRFELETGERFDLGHPGREFSFTWMSPPPGAAPRMAARFRELIEMDRRHYQDYMTGVLLEVPEVAALLPTEYVLARLPGNDELRKHVDAERASEPEVIEHFHDRLLAGDGRAVRELAVSRNIWADELVEPILALYPDAAVDRATLTLYERHRDAFDSRCDPATALVAPLIESAPAIGSPSEASACEAAEWQSWHRLLAMTHQPSAIPAVSSWLDDCADLPEAQHGAVRLRSRPAPRRVCDVALDTILHLLDEDLDAAYRAAGWEWGVDITEVRDRMIEDLRRSLPDDVLSP